MSWFKLNGYDYSQWNYFRSEYPKAQVEDIVSSTTGASWVAIENVSLDSNSTNTATLKAKKNDAPYYIKYKDADNTNWYFYRVGIAYTRNTDKDGKLEYYFSYSLDNYQTFIVNKLNILRNSNPYVYAKTAFANRTKTDTNGNKYIDIINDQKYLGNFIQLKEISKVRGAAEGMDEISFYEKNTGRNWHNIPASYNIRTWDFRWKDEDVLAPTADHIGKATWSYHFNDMFKAGGEISGTSGYGGKYTYIVCKSSALQKGTKYYDPTNIEAYNANSIILIPLLNFADNNSVEGEQPARMLFAGDLTHNGLLVKDPTSPIEPLALDGRLANTPQRIMNALFNINAEATNEYLMINPSGDNFIGIWTSDIPFISLAYINDTTYKKQIGFARNDTKWIEGDLISSWWICYIKLDFDAMPKFQVTKDSDFDTRLLYIKNNLDKLLPTTEPWMLNPNLYNLVYNNGVSGISVDLSLIKPVFTSSTTEPAKVYVNTNFYNTLNAAYTFGSPNEANSGFDNTKSLISDLSMNRMWFGSSSSTYLTNNANTLLTGLANLQDEQRLRIINTALNQSSSFTGMLGGSGSSYAANAGKESFSPAGWAISAASSGVKWGLGLTNAIINTKTANDIAWRNYRSTVKNIQSAPSQTLSTKSEKANLKGRIYPVFEWHPVVAHESDINYYFSWYLQNGYPYDNYVKFNDIENRTYMNVYNIASEVSSVQIENALRADTTVFNSEYYNSLFMNWLEKPNKIFRNNTWVNVFDWKADNYVHNIEISQ